ncbi:elongation factor G [Petroclostridium sp. X23]|uniref:elongation factor G n=1 Tax=Petroclostridium sp. X23 TaxID=3045146 RepID=UPI0024AD1F62|nr:elongation factor G [Petroclostridium sp. X23]WHH56891.1 elongation factor G [Petroclostridium sp. X23]
MKQYPISKIRNVCLMSHGGAGKTSLAEAILYNTGALDRFGKVADGTTTTDYDPEEIKRKISISTAIAPCEWKGDKLNIIDTPGYFDFVGEVMEGVRVADAAVIVVSGKSGVAVGTEKAWKYAVDRKLPRIVFVNKMDEDNSNFYAVLDQLREKFGKMIAPFQVPIREGEHFTGFVNVVDMQARKFDGQKVIDVAIPDGMEEKIMPVREMIMESVAESSEELMEKYFAGEEFTIEEIHHALRVGVEEGSIVPVLCGSALTNTGVQVLMDAIVEYFPSPDEMGKVVGTRPESDDVIERNPAENEPLAALVFKTVADPYVGKLSIFKVFCGTLNADSTVYNAKTDTNERIGRLYLLRGKKQIEVDKITAGDIGAVTKLANTNTGDTLCDSADPIILESVDFPEPAISLAITPKAKGDEEKIGVGLHRLVEEDPTLKVELNTETHQMLISGIGEQHLDIVVSKLKAKFGVAVDLSDPKVPYRETIKKRVKVEGKHKKQSGGHGQYGHVWIEFEAGETEDLIFEEKIFGGAVPRNFFPAVEKGLRESMVHGVLAGYPVVNLKATLVDGSYHPVDSSEMAFKVAASLAYKKGLEQAGSVLLEPIAHVEVVVPDDYMGDVIGDLNKRRGRILGMNPQIGGQQQVVAEVPMAEMFKYATDLRSMTQGRGSFSLKFERYEEAPANVAQKVIEQVKSESAE